MGNWKKVKRTDYGLSVFRQDMWGKYARKRANSNSLSKHERYIKYNDDLLHRNYGAPIVWFYNQVTRRRENLKISIKEELKHRTFRTRKLLQVLYDNLSFHNIKIHLKKAQKKNNVGYLINFRKQLERRLDVMCVRANLFSTLRESKQFIKNGLVKVNHQIIKSANYILKDKDILSVRDDLRLEFKEKYLSNLLSGQILRPLPCYLLRNLKSFEVLFVQELFHIKKIPDFTNFPWLRFPNIRKKP